MIVSSKVPGIINPWIVKSFAKMIPQWSTTQRFSKIYVEICGFIIPIRRFSIAFHIWFASFWRSKPWAMAHTVFHISLASIDGKLSMFFHEIVECLMLLEILGGLLRATFMVLLVLDLPHEDRTNFQRFSRTIFNFPHEYCLLITNLGTSFSNSFNDLDFRSNPSLKGRGRKGQSFAARKGVMNGRL